MINGAVIVLALAIVAITTISALAKAAKDHEENSK